MAIFLRVTFVILFLVMPGGYAQNIDAFTPMLSTDYATINLTPENQNEQPQEQSKLVNNDFKLYPNPLGLNRVLSVSGQKLIQNIKIYSILGKELVNRNFEKVKMAELNLKELNTGIYLIQVNNERTSRLIIE